MKFFSWFKRKEEKERRKNVLVGIALIIGAAALAIASFSAPVVLQNNPEQSYSKVTYNAGFTVHFSQMMNQNSVEETFSILPRTQGRFEWKDLKTLEFYPDKALKIGDKYQIVIGSGAKSLWMKSTGMDTTLQYIVSGPPYVLYSNPADGGLISEGEPITVMFDRPMAFKEISEKDLIKTNPSIQGEFRYMGLSAFQFTPKTLPSSAFTVTIPKGLIASDGGETQSDIEFELEVPDLKVQSVTPDESKLKNLGLNSEIRVQFNREVDLNEIKPGLNVLLYPSNDLSPGDKPKMDGYFNTEVTYATDNEGKKLGDTLVFFPSFPYLPDTDHRLILKASNGLELEDDYEISFHAKLSNQDQVEIEDEEEAEIEDEDRILPTLRKKMRWANDSFIEFFVVGQHPRLELAEALHEPFKLSVCAVSSSTYMRTNARHGWKNFECANPSKTIDPYQAQFGKELNLANFFKDEWIHGVYFVSLEMDDERLSKIFFIEDSSLLLKKSENDALVWVVDTKTGEPIPEMQIEIFSYDAELIEKGESDENGIYYVQTALEEGTYARGKKGEESEEYFALSFEDWTLNDYKGVSSNPSGIHLSTNQTIFKSGDTLEIKGIWREIKDGLLSFPEHKQVTITLEDNSHNELINKRVPMRRNGSFDASIILPDETPEGTYYLQVSDLNYQSLADPIPLKIRNEEAEIELEWINAQPDHAQGQTPAYIVQARYQNGLPASGIKGYYKLYGQKLDNFKQDGAIYYSFTELETECEENCYERHLISEGDIEFDEDGSLKLLLSKNEEEFLDSSFRYFLEVTALPEGSHDSSLYTSFEVHQGELNLALGLKHSLILLDESIDFQLAAYDFAGQHIEGQKVLVTLLSTEDMKPVYEESFDTQKLPSSLSISRSNKLKEGSYILRAVTFDDKRNEIRAEQNVYIYSEIGQAISSDLMLASDQKQYLVGGRAHLIISDPEASEDSPVPTIVSFEKNGVIGYEYLQLRSPITKLAVPIEEDMIPHFLVKVTRFHRGLSPRYSSDSVIINVDSNQSEILLNLSLEPENPEPGQEVTVNIETTDYQGLPLSAVITLDAFEGEAKEPESIIRSFFPHDPPPLKSSSNVSLKETLNSNTLKQNSSEEFSAKSNSFFFDPLLTTNENGTTSVSIVLPDEIEVLGLQALASKDTNRFGSSHQTQKITRRLSLKPILPSFVTVGDQTTFSASLKNVSDEEINSKIELESGEDFTIQGDGSRNFALKPGHQMEISFKVLINETNKDNLKLSFKSNDDHFDFELPVVHLLSHSDLVQKGIVSNFWSGHIEMPKEAYPSSGKIDILMSGSPELLVKPYAEALKDYPYFSTEILSYRLIAESTLVDDEDETALSSLYMISNQLIKQADDLGAFHYWNERDSHPQLTALALFAIKTAMDKGLALDDSFLKQSLHYLWRSLNNDGIPPSDTAFILWVLGLHGDYDTERTLELYTNRSSLDFEAQSFLLMNLKQLKKAGQSSVIPLIDRMKSEFADQVTSIALNQTDSSIALYALSVDNPYNALISTLSTAIFNNETRVLSRLNPKEACWTILALHGLSERLSISPNYIAQLKLNGSLLMDQSVTSQSVSEIYVAEVSGDKLNSPGLNDVFIKKQGEGELYFDAHLFSHLDPLNSQQTEEGLLLLQEYLSDDFLATNIFKRGANYFSHLEFIVPKTTYNVVLNHPLPAGFRALPYEESDDLPFSYRLNDGEKIQLYAKSLEPGVYSLDIPLRAMLSGSYHQLPILLQSMSDPSTLSSTSSQMISVIE